MEDSPLIELRAAIIAEVRKNWLFYVILAVVCGYLITTGILGLRDSVVTCHTWNIFVLDFSSYDMGPADTCVPTPKHGGSYANTKYFNNVIDGAKIGVGILFVYGAVRPGRGRKDAGD